MELRTSIASSPPALSSLVSTLCSTCRQARSLVASIPGLSPLNPSPTPTPTATSSTAVAGVTAAAPTTAANSTAAAATAGSANRRSGNAHLPSADAAARLPRCEQLLSDLAMLLINLLDASQAPAAAGGGHSPGLVGDSFDTHAESHAAKTQPTSPTGRLPHAQHSHGRSTAAAPSQQKPQHSCLGRATRTLLPAVAELAAWGEARGVGALLVGGSPALEHTPADTAAGDGGAGSRVLAQALASSAAVDGGASGRAGVQGLPSPAQAVALLGCVALKPRALLCSGYLCALALGAVVQQVEGASVGAGGGDWGYTECGARGGGKGVWDLLAEVLATEGVCRGWLGSLQLCSGSCANGGGQEEGGASAMEVDEGE